MNPSDTPISHEPSTTSEALMRAFTRTEHLLHRYHRMKERERRGFDPRRGQGRILALLSKVPEISQKELAFLLDIRPQSLGELLRKLEQSGLIERTPSPEDRRLMRVQLTPAGKSACPSPETDTEVFDCLSEAEQQDLCRLLGAISAHLQALTADAPEEPPRPPAQTAASVCAAPAQTPRQTRTSVCAARRQRPARRAARKAREKSRRARPQSTRRTKHLKKPGSPGFF